MFCKVFINKIKKIPIDFPCQLYGIHVNTHLSRPSESDFTIPSLCSLIGRGYQKGGICLCLTQCKDGRAKDEGDFLVGLSPG